MKGHRGVYHPDWVDLVFDPDTGTVKSDTIAPTPRREYELHVENRGLVLPQATGFFKRQLLAGLGYKTRGNFARDFLPRIGAEPTIHNLVAMMAWMQAEGDAARFNPINTTHPEPGSWDFNWVHVQNYASYLDGLKATAETLNYGADRGLYGYKSIRSHLRDSSHAAFTLEAVEASAWGTGGLALSVLSTTGWKGLMTNRYLHHRLVQ